MAASLRLLSLSRQSKFAVSSLLGRVIQAGEQRTIRNVRHLAGKDSVTWLEPPSEEIE